MLDLKFTGLTIWRYILLKSETSWSVWGIFRPLGEVEQTVRDTEYSCGDTGGNCPVFVVER